MRLVQLAFALLSVACGPPSFVDSVDKVDDFLARGQMDHACVGLKMRDEVVKTGTAERLAKFPADPVAQECLCRALVDEAEGGWDRVLAKALEGSRHEAAAACLGRVFEDPEVKDRVAVVAAIVAIGGPGGWPVLDRLARQDADASVRAKALEGLQGSAAAFDLAKAVLAADPDPALRRAAVLALSGRPGPEARRPLLDALRDDADGSVRAAAIGALGKVTDLGAIDVVCTALLEDAEPAVRAAAALAFQGATIDRAAACLARRIAAEESDGTVREAILAAARTSPNKKVTAALCSEMGPWLEKYVKTEIADRIPGYDIFEAQNNADWESSYACVERALSRGGLSCYARNYLASRFRQLGGKATSPWCPGMPRKE